MADFLERRDFLKALACSAAAAGAALPIGLAIERIKELPVIDCYWPQNPVRFMRTFMAAPKYAGGMGLPASLIDDEHTEAMADYCDELVDVSSLPYDRAT